MRRRELQELLSSRGLRPNARFGQNFLVDPALLRSITRDAGIKKGDTVLEVGPGAGALTGQLLEVGARVFAIELDRGLFAWLEEAYSESISAGNLCLVQGDILGKGQLLQSDVESWWEENPDIRIVSNLPYSISGPFLGRLPGRPLTSACLLLQKEMAERAVGGGRGKAVGPLSVRLALSFETRIGRRLPADVFWPKPAVDSAFLHLSPKIDAPSPAEQTLLCEVLAIAFQQRRKTVIPRLRSIFPEVSDCLISHGIERDSRPEVISPSHWLAAVRAQLLA